ncbi:MAG: methyltransferase domain-containing protein [Alphaproteobacteria bacterium]|nr:methyltransferase domain-containing protein [Alphaproteobacteria bacterium]
MLRALLDAGLLTCPACRGWVDGVFRNAPLRLAEVHEARAGRPHQGFAACEACAARYPLLDGVLVVFKDVGAWLRQQERAVMWRGDLHPDVARWLRGAWTDDEDPNWRRQMLAVYARALSPGPADHPLSALEASGQGFRDARLDVLIAEGALMIDAGCGLGAATLPAAARGGRVLALDSEFGALRMLARLLAEGRTEAPRWRHGGFDFVEATLTLPEGVDPARVALVAADALDPPLRAGVADLAVAWNLLDNVAEPVKLVRQLHAALKPGGVLSLSTPYDWSERATPRAFRLGEAIRTEDSEDPAAALRTLLTGGMPARAPELAMTVELDEPALPWVLRRHDRSAHVFLTHYLEARRPDVG